MMLVLIAVLLTISTIVVAAILYHIMGRREAAAELRRDDNEADVDRYQTIRDRLRLLIGPLPLSIAFHVLLFLFLLVAIHEQSARQLLVVNLEAGGGGGSSHEMQDLNLPQIPMPATAPALIPPQTVVTQSLGIPTDYVRATRTGIGIGLGSGMGSGRGSGIGSGFGGYIRKLRQQGLNVVLVVDGTGSMKLIINDVKIQMMALVHAIHRLVPLARVGIVIFGAHGGKLAIQPLSIDPRHLVAFLDSLETGGGGWSEDTYAGVQAAVHSMRWQPYAKKVVILIGDSPPNSKNFVPLLGVIRHFNGSMNGTLSAIDVAQEEHQRFEREFWLKVRAGRAPQVAPLPEFYQQTRAAYQVMAYNGGGAMRDLTHNVHINQQVLILAFGQQWRHQVAAFGRSIGESIDP